MTKSTRSHIPGEDDAPSAPTGATQQPVQRSAVVVPENMTHDQLAAMVAAMQAQMGAMQAAMADMTARGMSKNPQTDSVEPVTVSEANKRIEKQLAAGETPLPVLTEAGWLVHPLAHASAETVEEAVDKAAKRAALKKG